MPDKFDPYREALVLEEETVWPDGVGEDLDPEKRAEIERALHADPQACGHLEYRRLHTGFCRRITVTEDDLARLAG